MRTFEQTISAKAGDGYNIHVTFADGTRGDFDFTPYIDYPCYESLRNRAFFEKVAAVHGTLSWPNDIDISPEAVWMDAVRTSPISPSR